MDMADPEGRLAAWAAGLEYGSVPPDVMETARACLVDWLGVALAGACTTTYARLAPIIDAVAGDAAGPCTVLGRTERRRPAAAAWLNGAAGHVLDFDDTSYAGILHATAVVLPATLAAAQAADAAVGTLLTAFVAGVEVELALGLALGNAAYANGAWTTSTLGGMGAAAGVGHILGLDAGRMAHALNLAANQASGLRNIHGSNGKPYVCGWTARNGYEAAVAAMGGVACPPGAISGRHGLGPLLAGEAFRRDALVPAGAYRMRDPGIAFKRYPLCSAAQAAVDAVLALAGQGDLPCGDIARIDCLATPLVVECLRYATPASVAQAQFSMPFALATALLDGPPSISHLSPGWLDDAALRSLMARVRLSADPALAAAGDPLQCAEAARVDIVLKSGEIRSCTVLAAKGSPSNPLSVQDVRAKFAACARASMGHTDAMARLDRLLYADAGSPLAALFDFSPLHGKY